MPRARKPLEERLLDGTYKPSRHGPLPVDEPAVPAEKLKRPASLAGRAAAVWKELTALLAGVVRRRDVPVLTELCRWIERSEKIAAKLDALEATHPDFRGLLISAGIATDKVAALAKAFGITPADRAKIRAVQPEPGARGKPRVMTRPRTKLDQGGADA